MGGSVGREMSFKMFWDVFVEVKLSEHSLKMVSLFYFMLIPNALYYLALMSIKQLKTDKIHTSLLLTLFLIENITTINIAFKMHPKKGARFSLVTFINQILINHV